MSASHAVMEGSSAAGNDPIAIEVAQFDRHGYLFGRKITASLSPLFHQTIYEQIGLKWGQVRFDSSDMKTFLQLIQHPQFYGTKSSSFTFFSKSLWLIHLQVLL